MTRQELIERIDRHSKRANRWAIIWLASFFALLGVWAVLADGLSAETERALGAVIIAVALTTVFAVMLGLRGSMRRSGLVCPHCRALLTKDLWPVAVATGRCGKCGQPIVDSTI